MATGVRLASQIVKRGTFSRVQRGPKGTQIAAACMGLGFAWFATGTIQRELDAGQLKPLPMQEGGDAVNLSWRIRGVAKE